MSTFEEYNPEARHRADNLRAKKRKAGLASGAARRARSSKRPRLAQRDGLALSYRVQQLAWRRFLELDRHWRDEQGLQYSERGLRTEWLAYVNHFRRYRHKGQDFRTTNRQQARAMALSGRSRCGRTMQRVDARLAQKGLLARTHVKRCGDKAGRKDCIALRLLNSFVALPSATPTALRAVVGVSSENDAPRAAPESVAPPDGGREPTPAAPAGTEGEGAERPDRVRGEPDAADRPDPLRQPVLSEQAARARARREAEQLS